MIKASILLRLKKNIKKNSGYPCNNMVIITWLTPGDYTAIHVKLTSEGAEGAEGAEGVDRPERTADLVLRVGDFITYAGRPEGARIEAFMVKPTDLRGPLGMTYLPWRATEQRWATPRYTMKGNDHFIICYPVGLPHYGSHIDWRTVHLAGLPVLPVQMPTITHTDGTGEVLGVPAENKHSG